MLERGDLGKWKGKVSGKCEAPRSRQVPSLAKDNVQLRALTSSIVSSASYIVNYDRVYYEIGSAKITS